MLVESHRERLDTDAHDLSCLRFFEHRVESGQLGQRFIRV